MVRAVIGTVVEAVVGTVVEAVVGMVVGTVVEAVVEAVVEVVVGSVAGAVVVSHHIFLVLSQLPSFQCRGRGCRPSGSIAHPSAHS